MADTLPNIDVPVNVWVDLYALTGIATGSRISVENVGVSDVYLTTQATQPPVDHDAYNIVKRNGSQMANCDGASGAWAFCQAGSKLNIRAIT